MRAAAPVTLPKFKDGVQQSEEQQLLLLEPGERLTGTGP